MKHAACLSLSESRSYQPPHPLCSRGVSFTCYQGSDLHGLDGARFWLPRLRPWLQPLCFFHLHECNCGWLSSSAQCTSSGKVSSLSHRQSGQSAWHRGGRAVHRRFKAELSLAERNAWRLDKPRADKGHRSVTTWGTNKQTRKEKRNRNLLTWSW